MGFGVGTTGTEQMKSRVASTGARPLNILKVNLVNLLAGIVTDTWVRV
jgi:hypothetical protein